MEAPDKIWINTDTLNGYHMSNHPLYGEEYLRKGALLGWAKECFRLQDRGSWYSKGAADAFSKLIDKLNEM